MELIAELAWTKPGFLALAYGYPILLIFLAKAWTHARTSRTYASVASASVAAGLMTATFGVLIAFYLHQTGVNLYSDVDFFTLVAPLWFGLGTVFGGTRVISFTRLRQYSILRRVWSLLMAGVTLFATFLVLRHTYWVVFSGILGFVTVALIVWAVVSSLADTAFGTDEPNTLEPDQGTVQPLTESRMISSDSSSHLVRGRPTDDR